MTGKCWICRVREPPGDHAVCQECHRRARCADCGRTEATAGPLYLVPRTISTKVLCACCLDEQPRWKGGASGPLHEVGRKEPGLHPAEAFGWLERFAL